MDRRYFCEECGSAWRDFGLVPGMHLQWRWAGLGRGELRTAEEQTLASVMDPQWTKASVRSLSCTVSAGGRNLGLMRTAATRASSPGIAEAAARRARIRAGQFLKPRSGRKQQWDDSPGKFAIALNELVDEAGTPILYTSGANLAGMASACISFPGQRWLRFLVRGTKQADAVMTAIDQSGNKIIRYRNFRTGLLRPEMVQITVHPQQVLER